MALTDTGRHLLASLMAVAALSGACAPPSSPTAEEEIVDGLRTHLAVHGQEVPAEVTVIAPENPAPPLHSPSCFPQETPSAELIRALERSSQQVSPDLRSSWNRALDRLAAEMAGTEPDPPQGFFVSRPGVDVATGRALLYAEKRKPLAGFGAFFLLEKRGRWQVLDSCLVWES